MQQVVAPAALVWKNDSGARELEGLPSYVETAFGDAPGHVEVEESGVRFRVPVGSGQKTGWFYDQAANRAAFLKYVRGARVLDVFSYLGAWGLSAAHAGAAEVVCVDSSAPALELLQASADANGLAVQTRRGDAFDVLAALREAASASTWSWSIRRHSSSAAATFRRARPPTASSTSSRCSCLSRDGILVSCSCSHHLALDELIDAIQQAARHLGRFVQIVEVGGHAPDHPIHPAIPETRYLKALVCRVVQD